jgi:hypothetical protein
MTAEIEKTKNLEGPDHGGSTTNGSVGYERTDAAAGATVRAGLYILGAMFLVAAVLVPAYRLLGREEASEQERPANVIREAAPPPEGSFPRLVTSEPAVLADYRRKEDEFLATWGWVEKDRGIARMPVAEAMRIVGEHGALPVFPKPAEATGTAAAPPATAPGGGGAR